MVKDLPVGTVLRVTRTWNNVTSPNGSVCIVMPDFPGQNRDSGFTIRFERPEQNDPYGRLGDDVRKMGFFFSYVHWQEYFEKADGPW